MSQDRYGNRGKVQSIGSVVLDQARVARLESALENLRPRDRDVFLAASRDGLSYAEIAARHRCSVAKVRRIIARVLIELHQAVWPGE